MTGYRFNASSGSIRSTSGCPTRRRCSTSAACWRALQLSERIFAKVNAGLAAQGLLVKTGTGVDATILSAPSSTKNQDGKRDPEMSSTQQNGDWHFGMKAPIGVDAKSGLVHTVKTTTTSVHDSQVFTELTHGEETVIAGDSAYANTMLKANGRQA